MERYIFDTVVFFFAAVGFVAVVRYLGERLVYHGRRFVENVTVVLIPKGSCDGVEYITRSLLSRLETLQDHAEDAARIILLQDDDSPEGCDICAALAGDYDNVEVCTKEQLPSLLEKQ